MIETKEFCETWQATMNLRILRIPDMIGSLYGRSGSDTLQQHWICLENGRTEWRNVPVMLTEGKL